MVRVGIGPLRGAESKENVQPEPARASRLQAKCCGVTGVQRELETHDAKEKGEWSWWSHGAQQHDEKQCEKSADGKQRGFQGWRPKCS